MTYSTLCNAFNVLCYLVLNMSNIRSEPDTAERKVLRPFYILGHMANDPGTVDRFLREGANALEMDINFDENGELLKAYHGFPCDCLRKCSQQTKVEDLFRHINEKIENNNQLSLIMLDLKIGKASNTTLILSGMKLMESIINDLWKYGYDISGLLDLQLIGDLYADIEVSENIWQGDGITNCLNPFFSTNRLNNALAVRNNGGYITKVYRWTVDLKSELQRYLGLEVDAMITNQPGILKEIIESPPYNTYYRLATRHDNPFERA